MVSGFKLATATVKWGDGGDGSIGRGHLNDDRGSLLVVRSCGSGLPAVLIGDGISRPGLSSLFALETRFSLFSLSWSLSFFFSTVLSPANKTHTGITVFS